MVRDGASVVHVMTAGVPCRARHLSQGDVIEVYARRRNVEGGRISLGLVPVVWQMGWLDYVGFCGSDLFFVDAKASTEARYSVWHFQLFMFTKMQQIHANTALGGLEQVVYNFCDAILIN